MGRAGTFALRGEAGGAGLAQPGAEISSGSPNSPFELLAEQEEGGQRAQVEQKGGTGYKEKVLTHGDGQAAAQVAQSLSLEVSG